MKILYLTPWFPNYVNDSRYQFILDSIESVAKLGHEVVVLVTRPFRPKWMGFIDSNWKYARLQKSNFSTLNLHECHYISVPRGYLFRVSIYFYLKRVQSCIEKLTRQYKFDLIHAHTELAGIAAVEMTRKMGIPSVVTLHGISTDAKLYRPKTRNLLFEYPLSNANRVILVGHPLRDFASQFVSQQSHFRVISNGFRINHQNFNKEKKYFNDPVRFISVSNLHEGKGIDLNLEALASLNQKGWTRWTYQIIGDGDEIKSLRLLSERLNLNNQVKFLGACEHTHVYDYLSDADVFILPSYREACGVAYLEAMSFGLLTIGVSGQGPSQFIEHNKTGLLIRGKDLQSLTETLESIFISPHGMIDIAINGKIYVHQHLTWKNHAIKLLEVYKELSVSTR